MKKRILLIVLSLTFVFPTFAWDLLTPNKAYLANVLSVMETIDKGEEHLDAGDAWEVPLDGYDSIVTYSGVFIFQDKNDKTKYHKYTITFDPLGGAGGVSCHVDIDAPNIEQYTEDGVIRKKIELSDKEVQTIDLKVKGGEDDYMYEWFPLDEADGQNMIGDVTKDNIQILAKPNTSCYYVIKSMKQEDWSIVYNGNFEEGKKGFWSSYLYTTQAHGTDYSQGLGPEGRYTVGTNPNYYHQNFCSPTGRGNMLIANGSPGTDVVVYSATFDVEPNTNYMVRFEAVNVSDCKANELAEFKFRINGKDYGQYVKVNQQKCGTWGQFDEVWNSGDDTLIKIEIINRCTEKSGNDFCIDNIEYMRLCTSYDTLLIVNDVSIHEEATICSNDTFYYDGQAYTFPFDNEPLKEEYTFTRTERDPDGFEIPYTMTLHVDTATVTEIYDTICEGDFILFGGANRFEAGVYKEELKTWKGCDSIVYLHLEMNPNVRKTIYDTIFSWQDYEFGGMNLGSSGSYQHTFQSWHGCDSIVTLWLKVFDKVYISDEVCGQDEYLFGNQILTQSGVYNDTLKAANGNDSIVVLSLTIHPTYNDTIWAEIGPGVTYNRHGFNETESGVYTHDTLSIYGCDSTFTLVLTAITPVEIWMPNAFTPGSDNNNTFFVIPVQEDVEIERFSIYNRWGSLLFETSDITVGWDGKYKGEICQQGVYLYDVIYYKKGVKAKTYRKTGEVVLYR